MVHEHAVFLLGITFVLASYRGTPIVLVILAVLVLIYTTVMNRSVFGRHVYARGGNLLAAQLSGVNTKQIDFWLFVNMGVLAGIAGIAFTARSNYALLLAEGPGERSLVPAPALSSMRSLPSSSVVQPLPVASVL